MPRAHDPSSDRSTRFWPARVLRILSYRWTPHRRFRIAQITGHGHYTSRSLVALAVVAIAGCGAQHEARQPSRAAVDVAIAELAGSVQRMSQLPSVNPSAAPSPPTDSRHLLIFFKRAVGADPLASQLLIDRDGRSAAMVTNGGLEGEKKHAFTLPAGQVRALSRLIARTRLSDTGCCNPNYYTYWISTGGHSWRLEQGAVAPADQRLIARLDQLTDAHTRY